MHRYAPHTTVAPWRESAIVDQLLERLVALEAENLALREALCRAEFAAMGVTVG